MSIEEDSLRLTHIVVAAGSGSRFGSQLPKQFCELAGRPVVMRAIDALRGVTPGAQMVLVISQDMEELWHDLCVRHEFDSPVTVYGGKSRWESVRNGLAAVERETSVITVHDGARPLVSAPVVLAALEAVTSGADGAVPVIPMTDSLRHVDSDDRIHGRAVDRSEYVGVQTPQVFNRERLERAYSLPYSPAFTDDASVMEAAGYTDLRLTPGSPYNIKITNPCDLALAEVLLHFHD